MALRGAGGGAAFSVSDITNPAAASALDGTETVAIAQGGALREATGQQWMTLITGSTSLSGATVTVSKPLINLAQTWNDAGVAFDVDLISVTSTASAAASTVINRKVGGSSVFAVTKAGRVQIGGTSSSFTSWKTGTANEAGNVLGVVARLADDSDYCAIHGSRVTSSAGFIGCWSGSAWDGWAIAGDLYAARTTGRIAWTDSSSSSLAGTEDLILHRNAAATLQQGATNSATPVAQTLQAQGSRSGTDTNVAGASYTIRPGAGTGNAAPGALILQSYVAVASGTGAQTATTSITVSDGGATIGVGGLTFPTADPLIAGRWWDNGGVLTKSSG